MTTMRREVRVWVGLLAIWGWPSIALANEQADLNQLRRKVDEQAAVIQQQQATIQELAAKMTRFETRLGSGGSAAASAGEPGRVSLETEELAALPTDVVKPAAVQLPLEFHGYVDIGYVDAAGAGTQTSTASQQLNSRGDTLTSVGLDGDSSFLLNEIDLDFTAKLSPALEVVGGFDLLPRKLAFTTSGGTASTDNLEVERAYVAYTPFVESNQLEDTLFGDLTLYGGKFDSPMGFEYRLNEAPDRVNISRSLMSIYWTGYPVGVKARGKLLKGLLSEFQHSVLTYNLALTNAEPWLDSFVDGDRATNQRRVFNGRLSYGLDVLGGFLESGFSWGYGPRINQGDNRTVAGSVILDARYERGPFTFRTEYDYSNLDRPRTGGNAIKFSHMYFEGFYELKRPRWLPRAIPMVSLTPYYRYDTRDFNSEPLIGGGGTFTQVNRHTFALRYMIRPGSLLKGEYQLMGEAENASVNDNAFLASFVQQF